MPDKKLTDSEIVKAVKAYEEKILANGIKSLEPFEMRDIIQKQQEEINRLQAENERLKADIGKEFTCFVGDPHKVEHCPYLEQLETAKAEAYKKFAEKLKCGVSITSGIITCENVDNLLKEMVGEVKEND